MNSNGKTYPKEDADTIEQVSCNSITEVTHREAPNRSISVGLIRAISLNAKQWNCEIDNKKTQNLADCLFGSRIG